MMAAFGVGVGVALLLMLLAFVALLPLGLISSVFGEDAAVAVVVVGLLALVVAVAGRVHERRQQRRRQFEQLAGRIEQIAEVRKRFEDRSTSRSTSGLEGSRLRCEVCVRGRTEVRRRRWRESLDVRLQAERLRLAAAVTGDTSLASLAASGDRYADSLHKAAHHKRDGHAPTASLWIWRRRARKAIDRASGASPDFDATS